MWRSGVTRGGRGGRAAPGDTHQGVTPEPKILLCTILCQKKNEDTFFSSRKKLRNTKKYVKRENFLLKNIS